MTPRNNEDLLADLIERELHGEAPSQTALTYLDQHRDVAGSQGIVLQRALELVRSRRNFITISSMATAGLLIKPLGVTEAQGGFWQNLKQFFMTFGTSILFSFLTQGTPNSIPGFGGLSGSFLNPLLQLIFAGGCFGNVLKPASTPTATPSPSPKTGLSWKHEGLLSRRDVMSFASPGAMFQQPPPTKVLALVGNASKLNAGAAYLNKDRNSNRVIYPAQSYIGIQEVAAKILEKSENVPRTSESADVIKQKYYLPRWDGRFGEIAKETTRTLQPFTKNFAQPQFFESESGALVLITYEAEITKRDKSDRPKEGKGRSIVYTVPPGERKNNVIGFIDENSNFWANEAVRNELIGVMKDNIATGSNNESQGFAFSAAD